jgi:hypothetical protein
MKSPRVKVICKECGISFIAPQWNIDRGRSRVCSRKCSIAAWNKAGTKKIKQTHETEQSRWKGDKVGYFGVHDWLTKHYGQPTGCEVCGLYDTTRKYYWANISREYKRDRNDFKRMCMPCHRKYDGAGKKAWATFLKRKAIKFA